MFIQGGSTTSRLASSCLCFKRKLLLILPAIIATHTLLMSGSDFRGTPGPVGFGRGSRARCSQNRIGLPSYLFIFYGSKRRKSAGSRAPRYSTRTASLLSGLTAVPNLAPRQMARQPRLGTLPKHSCTLTERPAQLYAEPWSLEAGI